MNNRNNFEGSRFLSLADSLIFAFIIIIMIGAALCLFAVAFGKEEAIIPMIALIVGAFFLYIFKAIIVGLTKITLASELYILETKRKMQQETSDNKA